MKVSVVNTAPVGVVLYQIAVSFVPQDALNVKVSPKQILPLFEDAVGVDGILSTTTATFARFVPAVSQPVKVFLHPTSNCMFLLAMVQSSMLLKQHLLHRTILLLHLLRKLHLT